MNSAPDVLAVVRRSPELARGHDRAGWVGLFTPDATVQDPVGSRPHRGTDEIGRFYDTFIGPRDIVFDVDTDIVSGNTVIRDVTLQVAMSPRVRLEVPAILRYAVRETGGQMRIAELQAFWELVPMLWRFTRCGPLVRQQ
jgi:hypothetical protein